MPAQITGYEYEVLETVDSIKKGKLQCSQISHIETITIMEIMDVLRKNWNIVYPFE